MGILLELGSAKNPNKNPIAEKANQELELELLKTVPSGVTVSAAALTNLLVSSFQQRCRAPAQTQSLPLIQICGQF